MNANGYFDFVGKDDRACLKEMVHGYNISAALFAAVKLGLADQLESGPKSVNTLADEVGADVDALRRVLRLLSNVGVLVIEPGDRFRLSARGEYLRRSHEQSIANEVSQFAGDESYLAWSRLLHSVKTGQPGFVDYFGKPIFEYLGANPTANDRFHAGWKEISTQVGRETAAQYDFSTVRHVIDVGGGSGVLTAPILEMYPHLEGTIYDLPFSLASAKDTLESWGVADRCAIVDGDAMESVPAGGEVHLIKSVLHTCPDEESVRILRSSREALAKGGKVLVLERVIHEKGDYVWGNVVDVTMLVMTGGRERTLEHYSDLYEQAGLKLTRCIPLPSGFSIIEGEAA
jgi:hypothetical protein